MDTQVPTSQEPGVATLVKGIVEDLGDLIKQQFQFARAEVKADLRKTKEASTLLVLGVGIAFFGVILACLMLVHLLHWVTSPPEMDTASLPLWSCFAIVGLVFLGTGAVLIQVGRKKFSSFNPLPDQTVDTLKENVQWITNPN
jgi:hypothetical protein